MVDPIVEAASDPSFPRHALAVIKKLVTCSVFPFRIAVLSQDY